MKSILLVFLIISLFSCSKDKLQNDSSCTDYEKGDVIVGIKNTASIEEAFSLFNKLNLQVDELDGFFYTSPFPQDSLTSLLAYLNTKSYINTRNFSADAYVHYQTGIINVVTVFFNMNIINQQDWIKSEKALHLVDTNGGTKYIVLKVSVGQEKYWVNQLKENSMVTWTELNCIGQVQPL